MDEPVKIMEGFLEPEKCAYLIEKYQGRCARSTVTSAKGDVIDPARTSSTYFLPDTDPVVIHLRQKVVSMTGISPQQVEGLQLVRYAKGEQYKFHYDYFDEIRHNQRVHTFLVYLNDLDMEDGGCTLFKLAKIKVYPKQGRAVWFRNTFDDGSYNTNSLHAGEEVHGDKIKYAINIWTRQKPLDTVRVNMDSARQVKPDVVKHPETPLWLWAILAALSVALLYIFLQETGGVQPLIKLLKEYMNRYGLLRKRT
jgi:prolyl 4-hydroxylase